MWSWHDSPFEDFVEDAEPIAVHFDETAYVDRSQRHLRFVQYLRDQAITGSQPRVYLTLQKIVGDYMISDVGSYSGVPIDVDETDTTNPELIVADCVHSVGLDTADGGVYPVETNPVRRFPLGQVDMLLFDFIVG